MQIPAFLWFGTRAWLSHVWILIVRVLPTSFHVIMYEMRLTRLSLDGVLSLYISSLAKVNFVEAWHVQRLEEGELRNTLLTNLFEATLTRTSYFSPNDIN